MNSLSSGRIADTVTRSPVLSRVVVAAVAIALIGWLAVMERNARLYDRGIAAAERLDDPATAARAEADLKAARLLNPDRTPDVGRALILWNSGRPAGARAALEDVVRDEPDNLSAWTALAWVSEGDDARVAAHLRRLDPLTESRPPPPPQGR
jgi:predicted Zn-dependent protease